MRSASYPDRSRSPNIVFKALALGASLALNAMFLSLLMGGQHQRELAVTVARSVVYVSIPAPVIVKPDTSKLMEPAPSRPKPRPLDSVRRRSTQRTLGVPQTEIPVSANAAHPTPDTAAHTSVQQPYMAITPGSTTPSPLVLDSSVLRNAAKAALSGGVAAMAQAAGVPLGSKKVAAEELSESVRKAAREDCRTAHAGKGLLALPYLAWETATDKGCKW